MIRLICLFFLLPMTLFGLEAIYIVQPSGWIVDDTKLNSRIEQSFMDLSSQLHVTDQGFEFDGGNLNLERRESNIIINSERFSLSFPESKDIFTTRNEKGGYSVITEIENVVFILVNKEVSYKIDENRIIFPLIQDNKVAIAPNDLTIEKDFGGLPFDNIIIKNGEILIKYFGPIKLFDSEKNEYSRGEVMGTYNVSTWLSFHPLDDVMNFDFFPVLVTDSQNNQ